jgi:hypothetical protein
LNKIGGGDNNGSLPYSGERVQEFIKEKLLENKEAIDNKIGYIYVENDYDCKKVYLKIFKDKDSFSEWEINKEDFKGNVIAEYEIPVIDTSFDLEIITADSATTTIEGEHFIDEYSQGKDFTYTLNVTSGTNKPYYVEWSLSNTDYLTSDELGKVTGYYIKGEIPSITLNCIQTSQQTKILTLTVNVYDSISGNHEISDLLFTIEKEIVVTSLDTFGWIYCSNGDLVPTIDDIPEDKNPIGICIVPRRHTIVLESGFTPDNDSQYAGTARIMSLVEMSCDTPDEGTTSVVSMYWGFPSHIKENEYIKNVPRKYEDKIATWARYGSNTRYNGYVKNQHDDKLFYYYKSDEQDGPCPFILDDLNITEKFNFSFYHQYGYDRTISFNGKGNTNNILKYAIAQSDWKTSSSITDSYDSGYYPAACCCWRYHVDGDAGVLGTQQGDWYLPSIGELIYIIPRFSKIKNTIDEIKSKFSSIKSSYLIDEQVYLSSSEKEYNNICVLDLLYAESSYSTKDDNHFVRAFLMLK